MQAFKNTTMTKSELLKELKIHQKADGFIKGSYEQKIDGKFKGCAVGCSLESLSRKKNIKLNLDDHSAYEPHFGIPQWLARVEDRIFEGLPTEESEKWPVQFTQAINIGSDLSKIFRPFLVLVCESTFPHFDHVKYAAIKAGIDLVIKLLKNKKSTREQFIEARTQVRSADAAAYAAAAAAADAADAAAAAAAAYAAAAADAAADAAAAAYAAAAAAAYAAAAADADAAAAARRKLYSFLAKGLIKLIKECK